MQQGIFVMGKGLKGLIIEGLDAKIEWRAVDALIRSHFRHK
jgi:hypothetical protein